MRDPLNLVISADVSLSPVHPLNDHTWEICLRQGEPRAIAIRTRFGMRTVEMRYFPVFLRDHEQRCDPEFFFLPPTLKRFFPNYLEFTCAPFKEVQVTLEYWVPGSQVLAGRITVINNDPACGKLDVDWIGQITSLHEGEGMLVETVNLNQVLVGRCGGLSPVCFISGGSREGTSPYPGLALEINSRITTPQVFTWAASALEGQEESFNAAWNTAFRKWDAEISRVEITAESRLVEIQTGNIDWDAALHTSQKTGFSLLMSSTRAGGKQTFVRARNIGDGYSSRMDGGDLSVDWNGQSALDAWYLSTLLLPGGVKPLREILLNFVSTQVPSGRVGWNLGLGGATAQVNAQPVLAQLALRLMPYFPDRNWLRPLLPQLTRFFLSWLLPECDRDQDGIPEWRTTGQAGLGGVDLPWMECLESPSLAAMLLLEAEAIRQVASLIGTSPDERIQNVVENLRSVIPLSWNDVKRIYQYRDFETHQSDSGEVILEEKGGGLFLPKKKFRTHSRLFIHLNANFLSSRPFSITLRGRSQGKPIALTVHRWDFLRQSEGTYHVTREIFSQLDQVRVNGLGGEDSLKILTCDSTGQDISLLLPLAGRAIPEEQAITLARVTLRDCFLTPSGLRLQPGKEMLAPPQYAALILEGLLDRGEIVGAAEVISAMLDGLVKKLKNRDLHTPNALENTIPLTSFLRLCGVETITPDEIILKGFNPLPHPVRVSYRGTLLILHQDKSVIVLNQGEPIEVSNPGWVRIPLGINLKGADLW